MRVWILGMVCVLMAGCDAGSGGDGGTPAAAREGEVVSREGEVVYQRYCYSCHAAGIAGAPRVGNREAWQARLDRGREALFQATLEGVPPGMPPKGLCSNCSDQELSAAIDYMIETTMADAP